MKINFASNIIFSLVCMTVYFPVMAQEQSDTTNEITLNEIVISATRWKQESKNIPSKIISISLKESAIQNPQTAADLLGLSGKVFIQKSQQGGGSPMIRGFATNRLIYTVDGVRMNTAIFRGGNIQNVISLDPFAIEKTEVMFGPSSVIYGSDAIGGTMSFQTLTPQLSNDKKELITGTAVTRYETANNEKTAHLNVGVGWKKFGMISSFSSNDFGDLKMGSHGPDEYLRKVFAMRQNGSDVIVANENPEIQRPSGYSQMNLMQKFLYKPSDKWEIQYGFHYSETSEYARYDRHLRFKNNIPRYGEWDYGPQKWMMNNINITHSGATSLYDEMTIRLAEQFFEESRISRNFNKPDRETRVEKVNAFSANLDFIKTIDTKNQLFYGLEWVVNDVNSTGINEDVINNTSSPGPSRYPQSNWSSYGIYLLDQYKISGKFLVQGAIRYNRYNLNAVFDTSFYPFPFTKAKLNHGAVTGSLGFVYRPTNSWMMNMNLSTAFRSPNVDDIGKVFDSEPGAVTVPNPNLKAEYAYNIDLGIARIFGKSVKLDLTGYYTTLKHAMVRRNYKLNGLDSIMYDGVFSQVQAIQNAAAAHVYGVQAGLEVKLPNGFGFFSDFNFQVGEEELDDGTTSPLRHAAPWFGISRITYKKNGLNLEFYAMYSGKRKFSDMPEEEKGKTEMYAIDKNGNPWSPGWYTLNFKVMYPFMNHLSVSGGVENITDQRYRPYSSGIVAPGRNLVLSLKATF
ncbi:MAG: TonB-dependent receptor [Bacteroidetes bacterium]|nr:TonB-dependent receptor [Bacteroidota bacterium]MBS1633939.1 TonB-dependent receptor [Bacteroidota bacterium]